MAQSLPRVPYSTPELSCPPCVCGGVPCCLCTCQFPREPLFVLCAECFPKHLKTLANHNYLEVAAYGFIRGVEDLTELKKRNAYRSEMKESLRKIENCRRDVELAVDHLHLVLQEYKEKICGKLDECVAKVTDGITLVDKMQYTPIASFQFPYRNVSFSYALSTTSAVKEIENMCRFDIDSTCRTLQYVDIEVKEGEEMTGQKRKGGVGNPPKKKKQGEEVGMVKGEEEGNRQDEMDVLVVNFTP